MGMDTEGKSEQAYEPLRSLLKFCIKRSTYSYRGDI